MEKILRKSAIYGFFIGIGLGIFLVNYKEVTNLGDGITETTYLPIVDYIVNVLRFGVISALLGLLAGWYLYKNKINGLS
ncbi:MAG: hypothetical protein ABS882_07225 [Lysinibacillus sp.]